MDQIFIPSNTNTIAATATSGTRALPSSAPNAAFYNEGPNVVFILTGVSPLTATLPAVSGVAGTAGNATPIPVGTSVNIGIRPGHTHWAAICKAAGTAEVYCTSGVGE